jgi:hypothetical protein
MKFIAIFLLLVQSAFCVEFQCRFSLSSLEYSCDLQQASLITITTANEPITVTGTHLDSRTSDDVEEIQIHPPHIIKFLPAMVFNTFNNLKMFGLK